MVCAKNVNSTVKNPAYMWKTGDYPRISGIFLWITMWKVWISSRFCAMYMHRMFLHSRPPTLPKS